MKGGRLYILASADMDATSAMRWVRQLRTSGGSRVPEACVVQPIPSGSRSKIFLGSSKRRKDSHRRPYSLEKNNAEAQKYCHEAHPFIVIQPAMRKWSIPLEATFFKKQAVGAHKLEELGLGSL